MAKRIDIDRRLWVKRADDRRREDRRILNVFVRVDKRAAERRKDERREKNERRENERRK